MKRTKNINTKLTTLSNDTLCNQFLKAQKSRRLANSKYDKAKNELIRRMHLIGKKCTKISGTLYSANYVNMPKQMLDQAKLKQDYEDIYLACLSFQDCYNMIIAEHASLDKAS
jgi:hypothetical protein